MISLFNFGILYMERKEWAMSHIESVFKFKDEAVTAIKAVAKITDVSPEVALSNVVRTYIWILQQQTKGATIVAEIEDESLKEELKWKDVEMENFIKNIQAAREYFGEYFKQEETTV